MARKTTLILAFFLGAIVLFLQTSLFPAFSLLVFSPCIALGILRLPLQRSLFFSLALGALMDLISSDPFGVHALNYTLITLTTFSYRRYFLYDQPLHLGIFTFFISLGSTGLQWVILFLFDTQVAFAKQWAVVDFILMPLADGVYAMFAFGYLIKSVLLWKTIKKRVFPTSH